MTTPEPDEDKPSFGRDFRLVLGGIALLADIGMVIGEHVAKPPVPVTGHDLVLHIAWAVCALFLMDPKRALQLVGSIKDKIPGIGGG